MYEIFEYFFLDSNLPIMSFVSQIIIGFFAITNAFSVYKESHESEPLAAPGQTDSQFLSQQLLGVIVGEV